MTDTTSERPLLVKILVIIGFSATVLLIGWAVFMLIAKGPAIFSSLAERVKNLEEGASSEVTPSDSEDVSLDTGTNEEVAEENNTENVATPKPPTPSPTPSTPTQTPSAPSTPPQPTRPIYTFPVSDPNGFTDLKITTLGSGVLERGVLVFTSEYQDRKENAVRIDIENIGTKTSDTWKFTTTLPDGSDYTSPSQAPLKPKEHAVFTITFVMDEHDDSGRIISTVKTSRDTVSSNNTTRWDVEGR